MRTSRIALVLLLVVAGLTGCGLFGGDAGRTDDEKIQEILDEHAAFQVFLDADATAAQRADVEAALRALPGFTGVTFVDQDEALRRVRTMASEDPSFFDEVDPETLPYTFQVDMADIAAVQRIRDDAGALRSLPGVEEISFPCTTPQECRAQRSAPPR